jgi:HPr kinase/phosphorylase
MRVTVKDLTAGSRVLAGRPGLKRVVKSAQLIAPDLSADGEDRRWASSIIHIRPSEDAYLCTLPKRKRLMLLRTVMEQKPACIVVSGKTVCPELLQQADLSKIAVLKTGNLRRLTRLLVENLPPHASLHGVLVHVFRLGTLIIGKSAVGKSEVALDLLLRGHQLVADDVVVIERTDGEINGRPVEMGSDLLQIRGLGILNVRALYGESATVGSCKIGLVVELEEWQTGRQYTLIGARERRYRLLGINLPYLKLPVKPGRNMAVLVEVAVRNQLLKQQGVFVAREVSKRLKARVAG